MKKNLLIFLSIFCASTLWAQNNVEGVIKDLETQEPLPFVTVGIKNTETKVRTDITGKYTLNVQKQDTLTFALMGYFQQELVVANAQSFDVFLVAEVKEFDDVVITALGLKRNKRDLGYAVQSVDGEDLGEVRTPNLSDNLGGRIAGVQTTAGSSGVGSSTRVIIRGETSLSGNNQPLYVVDGVPISNQMIANNTENLESGFQEVDYGNGGGEIAADDIASITVLKGPGAAALYGTRAANGVIIIATKQAQATKGVGVTVNSSVTFDQIAFLPQFQNVYGQGSGGQFAYEDGLGGGINDGGLTSFGAQMNGQLVTQYDGVSYDKNGNPVRGGDVIARDGNPITATPFVANPNNVESFFRTGVTSTQNIALNSRNDNGGYRFSYSRLDNTGTIPNSDYRRNNLAFTADYQLSNKLKLRTYANFINSNSTHRPGLGYGSENLMYSFLWMGRQVNLSNAEDYWQAGQEGFQQYNYNTQWLDNPYFNVYENTNGFNKNRLLGNAVLSYDITDKISFRLRSGADVYNDVRTSKRAFSTQRFKNGAYREDVVNYSEINTDALLNYTGQFTEHDAWNVGVGANNFTQNIAYQSITAGELSVPGIYNFENSKIPLQASQYSGQKQINSVYALANYNFKRKMYLDATLRNDYSSTLPKENNSFFYYSASAAFVLSDWFNLPEWLSYSKLRMSSSSVGNDTDPFQLRNTYTFNQNYGSYPLLSNSSTLLNADLRPERINALEAGVELYFLKDRIGLDVTAYQNTAKDQIISLPASAASGYTNRVINGGVIQSKGIEIALTADVIKKKDFSWKTYANFTKGASYVEELPEGVDQYTTGYTRVYTSTDNSVYYIAQEGGRIGDMYGTGFKKSPDGRIIYDANGLPVRDSELRYLGNYNPDFMLGFGNEFKYKGFTLNFLVDWRYGGVFVSRTKAIGSTSGVLEETLIGREEGIVGDGLVNVGTETNPIYEENTTAISAAEYYNQFYNRANEESALLDASYVKLRQVSLNYTFPDAWVKKMNLNSFKVGFVARNLFTITENPHVDPELSAMQGTQQVYGVEDLSYPSTRSYGFNIQLTF
ncbi:TonB-linked outer membrane protein, SusC/RagA family [Lishizhenia tianjinensis]|uniref:TonB-linked outer membrane protein, SusC/RagA family n=1 Tax=Lishizhenia tianjinensis TaxID=477690 RepID=A0A1I6XFJ4_9FLAO|nr:SusC/RagA family TonB-linked outer membrane protein [Lishizhenia tianjinensis]SFT36883.1 TonB-linked outer membrane protein, SusC/RagA family [Lishizhenia tianjinensis]